jgi:uncharacterized protein (TIGR02301 family)
MPFARLLGPALSVFVAAAPTPTPTPAPAPAPAQTVKPPYEADLLRLAELMGALHYLRGLCHAADAQAWRERMSGLLEGEATDPDLKSRLTGAFNRGYRTFQQSYRSCNEEAERTIRVYLEEGTKLSRDVASRFGN